MDRLTDGVNMMLQAAVQAKVPTMLVGSPGTGKTATVKQLAKDMDFELITLVGSRMDATDIAGLPKGESLGTDENGLEIHATVNLSPWWQVQILQKKKVILFLDEFSNTSPSVRASMLTLLQDREFANGHKFPDETIVMGAMNSSNEAADGYELDLPTNNRIFFIAWNPTVQSWIDGMREGWGKETTKGEMTWKRQIAKFIHENPTWLHQQPKDAPTTEVYGLDSNNVNDMEVFRSAWASRRSWDNLSRLLSASPDDTYIQDTIAQGTVGYAASAALREWLRINSDATYKPDDVIADPKIVDWTTISVNDANMLLRNITDSITEENSKQVIAVFDAIADDGMQSLGGPFVQDLLRSAASAKIKPQTRKENLELLKPLVTRYKEIAKKQ
jgi:hypothetical protein